MTTLDKVCIATFIFVFIYAIVMTFKNNNTYKNHKIILEAINKYHTEYIKTRPPLDSTPYEVDYDDMEPYNKTYFRIWDWGYKHILPLRKYVLIKPYIEVPAKKEKRVLNFLKSKEFGMLILAVVLCVMIFSLTVHAGYIVKNAIEEKVAATSVQAEEVLEEIKDVEPEPQPTVEEIYSDSIPYIAKTVWGEARGCSKDQMAAVIWTILNRVEDSRWPNSIVGVITQPNQFHGYNVNWPVTDDIYNLTVDVLTRWEREKAGETDVGRILPKGYLYFHGANGINHFRTSNGKIWDWSLDSPYK